MNEGFTIKVHKESNVGDKSQMEDVALDTDTATVTSTTCSIMCTNQRADIENERDSNSKLTKLIVNAKKALAILAVVLVCVLLLTLLRRNEREDANDTVLHVDDENVTTVTSFMMQDELTSPPPNVKSGYEPFDFFTMGDIPYTLEEETLLATQVAQVDASNATFMVHVGDLMAKNTCNPDQYKKISRILFDGTSMPTLILPGDNDVMDCPTKTRLQRAMRRFRSNLINDTNVESSSFAKTFERQDTRMENFAFWKEGVLFVGLNMLGRKDTRHVDWYWNRQFEASAQWFLKHWEEYGSEARAIVIFAHSQAARQVYKGIKKVIRNTGIPVLYLHGNGHKFEIRSSQNDFVRVMVDRGGIAPPLKVSVLDTKLPYLSQDGNVVTQYDERKFYLFSGLFLVDRGLPFV